MLSQLWSRDKNLLRVLNAENPLTAVIVCFLQCSVLN